MNHFYSRETGRRPDLCLTFGHQLAASKRVAVHHSIHCPVEKRVSAVLPATEFWTFINQIPGDAKPHYYRWTTNRKLVAIGSGHCSVDAYLSSTGERKSENADLSGGSRRWWTIRESAIPNVLRTIRCDTQLTWRWTEGGKGLPVWRSGWAKRL